MQSIDDISGFLARQPGIVALLQAVDTLGLDDGWIGAGLIRNAVWDHLHGRPVSAVPGSDVDVVYCDPGDPSPSRDLVLEQRLAEAYPGVPWSVHNQARRHVANGDAPYQDVADAIRCWPETATAIAARLRGGTIEVIAPHGVGDLLGLIVRPTPVFARKPEAYRVRRAGKRWAERWPRLQFLDA